MRSPLRSGGVRPALHVAQTRTIPWGEAATTTRRPSGWAPGSRRCRRRLTRSRPRSNRPCAGPGAAASDLKVRQRPAPRSVRKAVRAADSLGAWDRGSRLTGADPRRHRSSRRLRTARAGPNLRRGKYQASLEHLRYPQPGCRRRSAPVHGGSRLVDTQQKRVEAPLLEVGPAPPDAVTEVILEKTFHLHRIDLLGIDLARYRCWPRGARRPGAGDRRRRPMITTSNWALRSARESRW